MIDQTELKGCIRSYWESLDESSETLQASTHDSSSTLQSSLESTDQKIRWLLINRGGLAKLTGLLMVPSQFLGPDQETSRTIINEMCQNPREDRKVERVALGENLDGVICYPKGRPDSYETHCILYHNPNGITTPEFFELGKLTYTPEQIQSLHDVPVILYDYRGTGLNQTPSSSRASRFRPTYQSIVQDGLQALTYAMEKYSRVYVWGSSLGGGVATASLEQYLTLHPKAHYRVTLCNHDSFTTTSRIVFPNHPKIADTLGSLLGGKLDAETPLRRLIERSVPITILCHKQDPVIPTGARMMESRWIVEKDNVTVITSPLKGHADLSGDMLSSLKKK